MEANGFKNRLCEAMKEGIFIKIIFQYPASDRATVKRGYVKNVYNSEFDLEEILDGLVTFSYKFIVEIMEEKKWPPYHIN